MDNGWWRRRGKALVFSLFLVAALAGAVGESVERFEEAARWRRTPADQREKWLYGPGRELFTYNWSHLPPDASILLLSDWDPALIAYYLHPRKIYQVNSDPETNEAYMKLPPSPYPRRAPESFVVDWVIRLQAVKGVIIPMIWEGDAYKDEGSAGRP